MMYHFFFDESNNEVAKDSNYMEISDFKEQLNTLNDNKFTSLNMEEIYLFAKGLSDLPVNSYGLTIDDGDESVYRLAFPVVKEANIKATNFIIGGWMGAKLPWDFIDMRINGMENHSHSFLMHQGGDCPDNKGRLTCIDYETGVEDTRMSFEYVGGGFAYCYPFGHYNDHTIKILKDANTKLAFTTEYGKIKPGDNLYALPRIRISTNDNIEAYMSKLKGDV